MRQFILYLVVAPLIVIATVLYFWFDSQKVTKKYWWNPDRETYVMFSTVQQEHKGSIEVRSRGKDFFKVGVPFKGEWLIWNNSFFERTFRIHIWIYDKKFNAWTEYTLNGKEHIITLAPMEDILVSTVGYIDPDVMWYERWTYKQSDKGNHKGFKLLPNARSVTLNLVISDHTQPKPDFSKKKIKSSKLITSSTGESEMVDPGLRVGEHEADNPDDEYDHYYDEETGSNAPPTYPNP
tara:strand:- start:157 stop:867 length:711 start_codon:yes stop_codon:yes gene_type:complete